MKRLAILMRNIATEKLVARSIGPISLYQRIRQNREECDSRMDFRTLLEPWKRIEEDHFINQRRIRQSCGHCHKATERLGEHSNRARTHLCCDDLNIVNESVEAVIAIWAKRHRDYRVISTEVPLLFIQ